MSSLILIDPVELEMMEVMAQSQTRLSAHSALSLNGQASTLKHNLYAGSCRDKKKEERIGRAFGLQDL